MFLVKVLGTQAPYPAPHHRCPGFLVKYGSHKILLDCGSGIAQALKIPEELDDLTVILTHLHADHCSDIRTLMNTSFVLHNLNQVEYPLSLRYPKTPESIAKVIQNELCFAKHYVIHPLNSLFFNDLEVTFCKMVHAYETYAVRFQSPKGSFVYTSDTSFAAFNELVEFAKDADLLISEASFLRAHGQPEICEHLTAAQAATIAKAAGVKQLALTHFWFQEDLKCYLEEAKAIFPNTVIAREEDYYFPESIAKEAAVES